MRRILLAAAFLVSAASLSAQQTAANPIEIGVDAGIGFTTCSGCKSSTQISIPTGSLRVGFLVSPAVSIEPQFAINSYSGGGSVTVYDLAVGALYHFTTDRKQNQIYARPFVGVAGASGSGSSSSQLAFGAGVGIKQPFLERLATRYEVGIEHAMKSGSLGSANYRPSANTIYGTVGFSFFTH